MISIWKDEKDYGTARNIEEGVQKGGGGCKSENGKVKCLEEHRIRETGICDQVKTLKVRLRHLNSSIWTNESYGRLLRWA